MRATWPWFCVAIWTASAGGAHAQPQQQSRATTEEAEKASKPAEAASGEPATTPAADTPAAPPPAETTQAETEPTAPPPAETTQAAEPACRPSCRAGFVCVQGQCVSACNPPCEDGLTCTAEGACVQPGPREATEELTDRELKAALRRREQLERERLAEWRKAHLYDHHLTLNVSGRGAVLRVDQRGADSDDYDTSASGYAVLSVGYMHNASKYFGVRMRLNLGVGGAGLASGREITEDEYYTDAAGTRTGLVEYELVPYAGPFGPFYIGPLGFVGFRGYRDNDLRTEREGTPLRTQRLRNRAVAGAGVGMGVVLGRLHDMHLSWSFRSSFTETLPFEAQIGFGYRFGRFWSKAEPYSPGS